MNFKFGHLKLQTCQDRSKFGWSFFSDRRQTHSKKQYRPKGVYLVVDATDMKAAFQEFLRITREAEDEQRAYDDELATVTREEACKIFNRSYSTLLRWEKDGYLVPVKIGKTPLYKMSDIKDVLNQKFGNS